MRSCLEFNLPLFRFLVAPLSWLFSFGYRYDKERTSYKLNGTQVELDRLEFGEFAEIEGRPDNVIAVERALGLNDRVEEGYSSMARAKQAF